MSRAATRTPLAVLVLIWLVGAGLWFAPPRAAGQIHGAVRDLLIPGQRVVQVVSERGAAAWRDCRARIAGSDREKYEALERETALWRNRALRLQARSADLARRLDSAGNANGPFPVTASEPLLVNSLLEARTLGTARPDLARRLTPIIDRGAAHTIHVDDLVLADDRLHLDLGADSGLQRDQLVLAGARILGRIETVGRWTSTVQPLTDEEYRGVAQLVRQGAEGPVFGAEGILAGNGDGTCRLELIAAGDPVAVGDTVFLPGHRTGLPGSIYYGRVIEATLEEAAAYWSIQVTPHSGSRDFKSVQVLLETPNPVRIADQDAEGSQYQALLP